MELTAEALLDDSIIQDPFPWYAELRDREPVFRVPGVDLALVSTWDCVTEAVGRVEDFSNHLEAVVIRGADGRPTLFDMGARGEAIHTLATADPPTHTSHRKVVFPELVERQMAAMADDVRSVAGPLIDAVVATGGAEWCSAVSNPLPMTVLCKVLGLPIDELDQLLDWAFKGTELLAGTVDLGRMVELGDAASHAAGYLGARLAEAMSAPGEDLLGAVAKGVLADTISPAEAVATLVILLGAGGESTTSLTGNAVRLLAEQPDLQRHLRDDPEAIGAFVEEVVRLESPFRGHYRRVARDCELGGVELEEGTTVLLLWASANRDPHHYERPDEVWLDRPVLKQHFGFGRGIHHCVGAPLARLEARVLIEELLARTTDVRLAESPEPRYVSSMFVRRHDRLHVTVG
ncbi:MAG: cytochrome P450 [Acidimicrobiales bacterium]|nr:cytochrome P450 [Acidimicrobiales bacterium]